MLELPEKLSRYLSSGSYNLAAIVGIIVSELSDPQSSRSDWNACNALNLNISTTLSSQLTATSTTSMSVASTDDFSAAGVSNPAYLLLTDGSNIEIIGYLNTNRNTFTNLARGQYDTMDRTWPVGTDVYQLTFSHGSAPDYDLEPQPRNWWAHLNVGGAGPPSQRAGHGWVYRPQDGCFYMFGGYKQNGNYANDLWKFDPSTKNWTQLNPGGNAPAARAYAAVVYSQDDDEIWVYGGYAGINNIFDDTYKYSFSGNSWSTNANWDWAPGRYGAAACYDVEHGWMIVSAGYTNLGQFDRANRAFNGSSWIDKKEIPEASKGGCDGLAYCDACWMAGEKKMFVVGRTVDANYAAFVYDSFSNYWECGEIADPPTSKRQWPACCYDPVGGKVLLFGGEQISDGSGTKDLWAYYYPTNSWKSLASFTFHLSADSFGRHGFAWDSENNQAVAWGGWNDDTPTWHTHDAPIYYRHFHRNVEVRTQTMDLGEAPGENGRWELEDVSDLIGETNSISYTAQYSDNDSTWYDLGTILDGDEITEKHRYWRVTVTFTTRGDIRPRVQKIDATFDQSIEFAFAERAIGDRLPLIKSIGALTSSIDPLKCTARIGGVNIELLDTNNIASRIVAGCYLPERPVYIKVGVIEDDVGPQDFVTIFTGIIEDWDYDGRVLKISSRDFLGKLEKDIPEEDTGGSVGPLVYNDGGIASHPVDILLDILCNRLDVPDRYIDLSSFEDVKADDSISDWAFDRTISDPTDAYGLCIDLCRHIGAILIPREDGRIALKMLKNSEEPVTAWNEALHKFGNAQFNSNVNSLRNFISTWWHWDGSGDEWSDFEGAEVATDAESTTNWGTHIIRTKSKWLGDDADPYYGDQLALAISRRILNMAREGLPVVTFEADIGTIGVQVGDVVRVQSSYITDREVYREWQNKYNPTRDLEFAGDRGRTTVPYLVPYCAECVDMLWWVTRKRMDIAKGKIKWELTRCRQTLIEADYDTRSDFYQGSGENIDLDIEPGKIRLYNPAKYEGWWHVIVDLGQQPEQDGEITISREQGGVSKVYVYIYASETGNFEGEEMYVGNMADSDDIAVKTRFYKISVHLQGSPGNIPKLDSVKINFPT